MNNITKIIIENKCSWKIPKYEKTTTLEEYINKSESTIHDIVLAENDIYKVYLNRNNEWYDKWLEFQNFSNLQNIKDLKFVYIENWVEKILDIPNSILDNLSKYFQKGYNIKWLKTTRWNSSVLDCNCEEFVNLLLGIIDVPKELETNDIEKNWNILWSLENESELTAGDVIVILPEKFLKEEGLSKDVNKIMFNTIRTISNLLGIKEKINSASIENDGIKEVIDYINDRSKNLDYHFAIYLWQDMYISKMWYNVEVSINDLSFFLERFEIWTIIRLQLNN